MAPPPDAGGGDGEDRIPQLQGDPRATPRIPLVFLRWSGHTLPRPQPPDRPCLPPGADGIYRGPISTSTTHNPLKNSTGILTNPRRPSDTTGGNRWGNTRGIVPAERDYPLVSIRQPLVFIFPANIRQGLEPLAVAAMAPRNLPDRPVPESRAVAAAVLGILITENIPGRGAPDHGVAPIQAHYFRPLKKRQARQAFHALVSLFFQRPPAMRYLLAVQINPRVRAASSPRFA